MPFNKTLVVICGPPAVGKMTVGLELSALTGLPLFHNHVSIEAVLPVFAFGTPEFNRLVRNFRDQVFREVAGSELPGLIFTLMWGFGLDSDLRFIEELKSIFEDEGGRVVFAELEADQATRLERNASALRLSAKPSKRDVPASQARLLAADEKYRLNSGEDFPFEGHLKIDNSNLSPAAAATLIAEHFGLPRPFQDSPRGSCRFRHPGCRHGRRAGAREGRHRTLVDRPSKRSSDPRDCPGTHCRPPSPASQRTRDGEGYMTRAIDQRWVAAAVALACGVAACGPESGGVQGASGTGQAASVAGAGPSFEVDPSWPNEMPDLWILGSVTGVFVDASDHVWVTHLEETLTPEEISAVQDPPIGTCCRPAPAVIEFDAQGNVVQGWGMPSQDISEYPRNPHGIFVDHNNFVWVGTYQHHRVQKFTRTGDLVMTLGEYEVTEGSDSEEFLGGPAGIWVDPGSNEVFVADGYRNRRVVVFDGETGAYLRHWGAYGAPPDDDYRGPRGLPDTPPEQFSTVHGITGSSDGLLYVADRRGNRIQVFEQSGAFVAETFIAPETLASGSSFVPVLSKDPAQTWLYLADGTNHKVWILDRASLDVVGEFGRGGRQVGQFLRPHGMSIDSEGNLYVGEASTGRRVQKFTLRTPQE